MCCRNSANVGVGRRRLFRPLVDDTSTGGALCASRLCSVCSPKMLAQDIARGVVQQHGWARRFVVCDILGYFGLF